MRTAPSASRRHLRQDAVPSWSRPSSQTRARPPSPMPCCASAGRALCRRPPAASPARRGRGRSPLRRRRRQARRERCARRSPERRSTSSSQPARQRRKRLFLADMDSTMIEQECIDELADYVGLKAEVAAITERAMRGEIAFEPALRERVALLEGLPLARRRRDHRRAHHADARRARARAHDAGARRLHLPRLGRLHAVHRPDRAR